MKNVTIVIQFVISCLLITAILLQAKGVGLGRAWGGGGEFYRSKRGVEKILFKITVILAFIFLLSSLFSVLL
jgi:preprotein translocase subunit SecG